jgi:hypothetical protein
MGCVRGGTFWSQWKELSQTTETIRKKRGQIKKEETENVYYPVNAV